jgi:glycosyltransferase involved in cell wall biosynthesis
MRIGMISPISWRTPPDGYGPWELVVSCITEELVAMGHDVTLFATADSITKAKLHAVCPKALRPNPELDSSMYETMHLGEAFEMADQFDIIHNHLHYHGLAFSGLVKTPVVSTLHGAAWVKSAHPIFLKYKDSNYVSLSNAERTLLPELNYVATVYNGMRLDEFPLETEKDDFLLFAGRLSPEKGPDLAVQLAKMTGRRLLMAGMIEDQHKAFYDEKVAPLVDGKQIEYLGMLDQRELAKYYRKAAAVLFLISWCEPCSLVAIETQASGTPIIGTNWGCIPEIVEDGKTGFLVDTVEKAAQAVEKLTQIDPRECRARAERMFSAPVMAKGYVDVYNRILAR